MRKKMRARTALILALCLCVSLLVPAAAVSAEASQETAGSGAEQSSGYTYGNSLRELIGQQFSAQSAAYDPDEVVCVIVQLDAPALLDDEHQMKLVTKGGDLAGVNAGTLATAQKAVEVTQQKVKNQVGQISGASLENSESFTLLINAFTVEVPYKAVSEIRSLDGVKSVFVNGSFSVPEITPGYELYTYSSSDMIGLNEPELLGLTGEETLIAVLDTGIEYNHEAFAAAPSKLRFTQEEMKALVTEKGDLLNAKIAVGWDPETWEQIYENLSPEQLMISDKIVYSFDYANVDYDATADAGEHGVHVAGIAAGHTVDPTTGETTFSGAAPDAQLAVMKVFNSWTGACATTTLLAALEDCVLLDVDVINMSLGTPSGFDVDVSGILLEVMQKIEDAGIVLAVAAGNDTNTAENNPVSETNLPQVETPDYGLVSSPSTYHGAFSVASVNNTMYRQSYLLANDLRVPFSDSMAETLPITAIDPLELVAVPGVGDGSDYEGLDVTGKAVLVRRGEISFSDKVKNAADRGAKAVLVYDNEDSSQLISMQLDAPAIPSAFISKADGEVILEMLENGETVMLTASEDNVQLAAYPEAGLMSSFSSWGATSTLAMKPEITAPGGNIYSSVANNGYASMSGTSMASPQIAGAAAILIQYLKEQDMDMTKAERAQLIYALMMSTADPVEAENGLSASVRQQGAGLVDMKAAVSTAAVLFGDAQGARPKAELGDSEDGSYQFSFVVKNLSDQPLQYSVSASVLSDTAVTESGVSYFSGIPQDISGGAEVQIIADTCWLLGDVNFDGVVNSADARAIRRHVKEIESLDANGLAVADVDGDGDVTTSDASMILLALVDLAELPGTMVTVPADGSVTLTVTIQLSDEQIAALNQEFPAGAFVEGYVTLNGFGGNEDLSYPYLGFLGDWEDQQLFDSTYYDDADPMVYDGYLVAISRYGSGNYLGFNYFTQSFDPDKLYFSSSAFGAGTTYLYSEVSLLRNAENVTFTVANADTDETLYVTEIGPAGKTYYSISSSSPSFVNTGDPTYLYGYGDQSFTWPEEGGHLLYTVSATHEGDEAGTVQTLTFPQITVDETAPSVTCEVAYNEAEGMFDLTLKMTDNGHIQGARISGIRPVNQWFSQVVEVAAVSSAAITEAEPNTEAVEVIHLPDLQKVLAENGCLPDQLVIEVVDYAWNVTELEIALTGSHFVTEDNGDGTVTIIDYAGVATSEDIPEIIDGKTVTAIGDNAFAGSILSSVTIPETVTSIGAGAFQDTDLTWVKVPAAVTEIGEKAFGYDANGEKLEDFTMCVAEGSAAADYAEENGFAVEYFTEYGLLYEVIDSGEGKYVSVIGYDGTSETLDIPATLQGVPVEEIGYRAFFQNEVLTSVTLPEGLLRICNRAFMYTNIGNMDLPATLTVIEEGAFSQMPNLTSVNIPGSIEELPYMAFANDVNLTSVTLNEGLKKLGSDTFAGTGITEIDLPESLESLGECTFQNCTSLTKVSFPENLTVIPMGCFYNSGFTELVIPEGITTIEGTAFASCANLVSVTIPASVVTLGAQWGSGVFHSCPQLTTVNFAEGRTELLMIGGGTFQSCTSLASIELPDCSYIGLSAFTMTALTSIEIPATCTEIGFQAFYMCESLETITLSEGLTTIGMLAFCGCPATEVFVPASVTSIANMAFGYKNWSETVEGFTIRGYAGSAAETYANENGFSFVAVALES